MKVSPLAPKSPPILPPLDGVRMATCAAGIKCPGRTDLLLMVFDKQASVAGVFTKSKCASAPVDWCRTVLAGTNEAKARAVVVNAGNANAFTGQKGADATLTTAKAAAKAVDCDETDVFLASTGVIGEPLPHDKITAVLEGLNTGLDTGGIAAAAKAIMTTDTFPKGASANVTENGKTVQIAGIAKGSGMIAPDMATMLVYIFTDAQVDQADLQSMVSEFNEATFNCITVDSDTSTSDSLIMAATGASGVDMSGSAAFKEALHGVMLDLAHQVVKDGEGAQKFITISVKGAENDKAARAIGMSIANSPLVKTAIAGEDANWGRIVMAVGKSGEKADRDRLEIAFGPHTLAKNGLRAPDYDEDKTTAYMRGDSLEIAVNVGIGKGVFTVWTCDLTHGYIDINADYRS